MTVKKMKNGFYPALGTPTDTEGKLVASSYTKQVELMIAAGAKGLLCMGSMGKMASIGNSEYVNVAKQCTETVSGSVPIMVGVMDCSVSRVIDRVEALGNIKIDGIVATVPYYYKLNSGEMISFFEKLSQRSKYPVYIYDLPPVTQSPITFGVMETLLDTPNIRGMKTANLGLILDMHRNLNCCSDEFSVFYSGLDLFDVAINSGIGKNLDGMFSCTPFNSKKMYEGVAGNNPQIIAKYLNNIIQLRNIFIKENVFSAFSYAMGLLGCPGNYHADYDLPISENLKEEISVLMKDINEI